MKLRLYRFYHLDVGRYGEPFALCDECRRGYGALELEAGILECVAKFSLFACDRCSAEAGSQ